jgi:hypothetical protein
LKEDLSKSILRFFQDRAKRGGQSITETPEGGGHHAKEKGPIRLPFDALLPDQQRRQSMDKGGPEEGKGGNEIRSFHK